MIIIGLNKSKNKKMKYGHFNHHSKVQWIETIPNYVQFRVYLNHSAARPTL